MSDEIIIEPSREEMDDEEYNKLLAKLDELVPATSGKGFDWDRITGNMEVRTAKAIILNLSCKGWSVARLAEALEVEPEAVRRYLADAMREACPLDDLDLVRRFEEYKLDLQAEEIHRQFARSCEDEVTVTKITDEEGNVEIRETRKGQSGNPAYQRILIDIARHRARLLGLEKPTQVQVDKTERKLIVNVVEVKNREEALVAQEKGLLK